MHLLHCIIRLLFPSTFLLTFLITGLSLPCHATLCLNSHCYSSSISLPTPHHLYSPLLTFSVNYILPYHAFSCLSLSPPAPSHPLPLLSLCCLYSFSPFTHFSSSSSTAFTLYTHNTVAPSLPLPLSSPFPPLTYPYSPIPPSSKPEHT